jgi:PDZ domain-containing secreted protein
VLKLEVPIKLTEHRDVTEPSTISCRVETMENPPRVIKSIDGKHPADIVDAYDLLLRCKGGEALTISYAGGETETVVPRPTPLPDAIVQAKGKLGLTVELLTPMLAEKYHLGVDDGIFIDAVARDSVASRAGVEPGDVLTQLENFPVKTLDDLSALLNRLPTEGRVRVGIMRQDQMGFGVLDFGAGDQAQ